MSKTRLLAGVIICLAVMTSLLALPSQAAWRDYKYQCAKLTEKPKIDGVINDGEYGDSQWITINESVDGGQWAAQGDSDIKASYIFAWADDGIHIGVKAENDMTPNGQNGPETGTWWAYGDMVQVFFNPGYLISEGSPVLFDLGFNNNAKTAARRSGFNSADEAVNVDATSLIEGYSVEWKDGRYCMEVFIPWSEILLNGMDRDTVKVTDLTGWTPAAGGEIGIMVVYFDLINPFEPNDGNLNEFAAYRSDVSGGWGAEEMGSISIILGDAPAVTDAPADVGEPLPSSPNVVAPATSDIPVVLILIAAAALAGVAVFKKKSFVK